MNKLPSGQRPPQSPISNKDHPQSKEHTFDLQDRLVDFAVWIIRLSEAIPETKAGEHICAQVLRSGTSPAPIYSEAQSAESKADFIHKLKLALKELRETEIWLKILVRSALIDPPEQLAPLLKETDELIALFFKSARERT